MADKNFKISEILSFAHSWEFEWIISNHEYKMSDSGITRSPDFHNKKICPLQWRLFVESSPDRSYCSSSKSNISIGLQRMDSVRSHVQASLVFEIRNSNGNLYLKEWIDSTFTESGKTCKSTPITKPSNSYPTYGPNNREFYCGNNILVIKGKLFVQQCCKEKHLDVMLPRENIKQLQLDFKTLLQDGQFSDIELHIENDVVHTHKFVLCARSPVFRKMFENDMKEKKCNSVKITDTERPVLMAFLIFLYTGKVEDKKMETVMSLYSAADKYEVETLQKTCSDILISYIKHDTVSAIMKLADMHSDANLRDIAVEYICRNFSEVESSTHWKNLLDSDPRLASFALKKVSLTMSKK